MTISTPNATAHLTPDCDLADSILLSATLGTDGVFAEHPSRSQRFASSILAMTLIQLQGLNPDKDIQIVSDSSKLADEETPHELPTGWTPTRFPNLIQLPIDRGDLAQVRELIDQIRSRIDSVEPQQLNSWISTHGH